MPEPFIMQMRPWFGQEEKDALAAYMDEDGFLTEFKHTAAFEREIADYVGCKHCVAVNNGTVSLTLAALACGIRNGDEVIVPNFTMIATPNSVQMIGARPVFVDVEKATLCLDIDKVKAAITPATKAIMLVSANGRYPKSGINAFKDLCERSELILIEDSAQSLGSRYPDGRHIGTSGHVGSFSFSAPKVISTGQGGAVITDDDEVADRLQRLKDFGRTSGGNDIHDTIGYNFKFTELQAVIGLEQMKKLAWRVERKKQIHRRYCAGLSDVAEVSLFDQDLEHTTPWFIDCCVDDRDGLQAHLKARSIGTRVMYSPLNRQTAYRVPGAYPVSEWVGEKGLWLPSASQLTNDEIDRITAEIRRYF